MKKAILLLFCFLMGGIVWGQTITPVGPTGFCPNGSVTLTVTGAPAGSTYQWQQNGSNIPNATGVTYNASVAATYTVVVTTNGTPQTLVGVVVEAYVAPVADFSFDNDNTCSGTNIQFSAAPSSGTPPYSYSWDFGDATSSNTANPVHAYTALGCGTSTFTAKLTVTDANGCTSIKTKTVTVKQVPEIDMKDVLNPFNQFNNCTHSPSTNSPNFTIGLGFNSPSPTCATSYSINWGDGNTQSNIAAASFPLNHTYTQLGMFDLVVTVTGTNGCSYSKTYKVVNQSNPAVGILAPGSTTGCAPVGFWFKLRGYELNSPGTTYTWDFGDGTATVTWGTPVNVDSIFHTFNATSCTKTGGQFVVKVTATNGCKSTTATVDNITVYIKPIAGFTTPTSACANTAVNFTNTTVGGYNQGSCDRTTLYSWNFGDPSSSQNTSSLISPSHTYSTPGLYTITLIAEGSCGKDTLKKTICITSPPTSVFTLDKTEGCVPLTVTANNTSNTGASCTTAMYAWSVNYSASNCGTAGSSNYFTNGTNASSVNPSFLFSNPGTYTITLQVTNACGTVSSNRTVVVKSPPKVSFSTIPNACNSASFNPNTYVAVTNCGNNALTYLWTFTGGTPATSTNTNPGTVTFNTIGTNTVTLAITNECGTTTVSKSFTLEASPDLTVPANTSLCAGQAAGPFNFTTATSGATISWSNNNTAIGLGASGSSATINSFTATNSTTNPITATITVTASRNGCSTTQSFTITVNPKPAAPIVSTPINYCQNETATPLTATALSGHTLLWYTVATGGTGTATAPTPATTTTGTTTYYVSQSNTATGCESNRAAITVTVRPIPAITATFTNPTSCASATGKIVISGLVAGTPYTVNYTKNGTPVTLLNQTAATGGTITINNLTAGIYSNITVTLGGCPSNVEGPFTLSDPNPPATPTPSVNGPICAGGTLSLSTGAVSGATYTWSGPNNYSSNQQNPSITNATTAASGNYLVTVTVAGCTSAAGSVSATVNATPVVATAGSNSPVCTGNSLTLTASTSFTDPFSWSWTGPNGFTSAQQNPSVSNVASANAGTYTVTATATTGGCASAQKTVTVVVNPTPVITNAASFDPVNCNTSTGRIELSGLMAGSTYTVTYTKNGLPVTTTIAANASGVVVIGALSSGVYDNIKVTLAGCPSNTMGPYTLADPNPPATPVATGASPICSGTALNLTATTTTTGAITWAWTGPNGYTSAVQNPVINNTSLAASGTYNVTATLNGCKSAPGTVTVVVNETPAAPIVSSNSPVCTGNTLTLSSTSSFAGALTYAWTGPNSFSSSLQNPSIPNATAAATGPYQLVITATTGNCPSAISTTTVTVNPTPVITGSNSTNPTNCNTSTGSIILQGLIANTTYTVNYVKGSTPQTATVTANATGEVIIANLTSGIYNNVSVSILGCASNMVGPFTLTDPNPPATPVALSNGPICSGNTLLLSATTTTAGNLTWSWTGPAGYVSNAQNPAIAGITVAGSGTYSVTVTQNGCTSTAGTVPVVINQSPAAPMLSSNGPVCAGSTLNLSATTTATGTVVWDWTGPNGFSSSQQNPAITNATTLATGTYTVTIVSTQGTCPSPSASLAITVHPELVNKIDTNTKTICYGQPVTITGETPSGGNGTYTYQWEQSTDNITWTAIAGQTGASLTLTPQASIYLRRRVSSVPCQSFSLSVYIAVQPPVTNNTIQTSGAICINTAPATFIGSSPIGANGIYSYQWEQSTNNGTTWTAITGATAKDYTSGPLAVPTQFRRVVTTSLCSGPQSSTSNIITITINPDAKALFLPTETLKCPPFVITPAIINLQPATANSQYNWYANGTLIGSGTSFPGYTIANENDSVIIKLVTISAFGCKNDSLQQKFKTIRKPTPSFTMTDTVGCGPITVSFTNTSTYVTEYTYFWDFGNGQTSTAIQPTAITFAPNPSFGDTTYVVKLKVFSPCDTLTFSKSIRVKSKPKALFTPTKTVGCSPMTVTFRNTSKGVNNTYFWDFGDGTTFSTASSDSVQHTFITGVVDTFYVKLRAVNECGSDSIRYSIIVSPNTIRLNLAVNGTDHFGCAPHAVPFVNNSQGASVFSWNFGDGATTTTTKNVDTVYHTYLTPGTYTVTIRAINNCSDTTTTETITVYPKPTASFTASTFTICKGDSVKFSNQSTSATAYLWQFGDGATSTLSNPSHTYTTPAVYVVKLITYRNNPSGNVCTDTAMQTVTVTATQTGLFTASDTSSLCAPFTVTLVNKNKPSVTAAWDFGDGTTATGDSVVHTYLTFGTYLVKLTVTVPGGCTYITTKQIVVNGPGGTLRYTGNYKCYPAPVQLQTVATGATNYVWDFGDGVTLSTTQQTVFHSYANPGFYLPKVTLQNSAGCNILLKGLDTIKVDRIDAGFTMAKAEVCGSTTITFTDTTHAFFGKQSIRWNFGDNTTGIGASPTHVYAATGTYTIQQIVVGNSGCSDTVTRQILVNVKTKPVIAIVARDTACTRRTIQFNSSIQSADAINLTQWNLSNGASGQGTAFSYTFAQPGTYNLRLVVGTVNGCYDTAYHTITIHPSPVVTATPSLNLCRGATAQLNVNGAATYQWLPLTGLSCYTCPTVLASPTVTTPYVVEGKNSFGCADWDTVVVTVIQPLKLKVSPSDSICIGQSKNLLASGASSYTWSPAIGLNNTTISNPTASPTVTTTYRVVGYDGFNCFTDTAFVTIGVGQYPTVNLGPDLTLVAGTMHPLTSTVTNGPITKWTWTPSTNLNCATCAVPIAEIKKNISYSVVAANAYGCSASDTINIAVTCNAEQVYIPNAFSPDGDGINDVFMVRASGVVMVKYFRVFNRWGELVFEQSNFVPNNPRYGWDGKVKGIAGGPDVFVYTCEAMCENGTLFTYKGNVTIIK